MKANKTSDIIEFTWWLYQNIVVTFFTVFFVLMLIIGGSFSFHIEWKNVTELFDKLFN